MKSQLKASEIRPGHLLLDVRSPREFEAEKVPGALNIPLGQIENECDSLSDRENLVLVCASGMRARKALDVLASRGIKAQVLEGGLKEWIRHGLPVEKTPMVGLSIERQVRTIAGLMAAVGGALAVFVNPWFGAIPTLVGCGLIHAGITDQCAMAVILAKLPYNTRRAQTCCQMPANQS